ncbi:uncharacterized protein BKA55DRAFT_544525 [Fusarium redolens]|uniref:Uncharacterized protein n=1 Tax=Fusarium redolens TaxID=48865 RepID=A0A9P9G4Q1_FUSRE|nr:uncharacterized protein BKA55DRAFT_544525 [Fusarium redolens]KAH7232178.1 hypothetical protein BKA55DRAFT_544525 [Fusarium redolens]
MQVINSIHLFSASEIAEIFNGVKAVPEFIQTQTELRQFQVPPPTDPILFIAPPKLDGLRCGQRNHVYRQVQHMLKNYKEEHGWQNDWKKGGNVVKRAQGRRKSRVASKWFEVGRETAGFVQPTTNPNAIISIPERISHLHQEQDEHFKIAAQKALKVAAEKKEVNAWIERTGWAEHMEGLKPGEVHIAAAPIGEDEPVLQLICDTFDRMAT